MESAGLAGRLVCYQCIGESFLSDLIHQRGSPSTCDYCDSADVEAFALKDISEAMSRVFEHSWTTTPRDPDGYEYALMSDPEINYEWNRRGDRPVNVVEEVAKVSAEIARDIVEVLGEGTYWDPKDPDYESPYSDETRYEPVDEDQFTLNSVWAEMKQQLHHRARFFNNELSDFLADLFADIQHVKSSLGPAVRRMGPSDEVPPTLFRARTCLTTDAAREVLSKAPASLGAPSGRLVRAGRMNAAGIPVFYGAMALETCLAEVRPPVGSSVVVGQFALLRDVLVLDLRALEDALDDTSPFDPTFTSVRRKYAFLKTLSRRFSASVMPGAEDFDYLLTQAVCEYLAGSIEPRLDGIAFPSAQTGGQGTNVTLFRHASAVEPVAYPAGTKVSTVHSDYGDDESPSYTVWVELPAASSPEKEDAGPQDDFDVPGLLDFGRPDADGIQQLTVDPTLRLNLETLQVIEITGVSYTSTAIDVSRHEAQLTRGEF